MKLEFNPRTREMQAHCPKCDEQRRCYVRGAVDVLLLSCMECGQKFSIERAREVKEAIG